MNIIVTGAAGFIGSNIVKALNARGVTDIVAVDNLTRAEKMPNLADCEIADYLDKEDFIERVRADEFDADVAAVLHQGACSDTMETDGRYMMENNYRYSLDLLDWCQRVDIPFIYASSASVYGAGRVFRESREHEGPLNVYGYSKFLFDQVVRRRLAGRTAQVAGFRYFNVYGPREAHKGRMASVAFHFFNQYLKDGQRAPLRGSRRLRARRADARLRERRGRGAGEPLLPRPPRDLGHLQRGHGHARRASTTWPAPPSTPCAARAARRRSRWRSFARPGRSSTSPSRRSSSASTRASPRPTSRRLRAAGYGVPFLSVEEGVGRYVAARVEREGLR